MKYFYSTIIILFAVLNCNSQPKMVTGIVKNSINNLPVQNAEIWNNDKPSNPTQSQHDGKFELHTTGERILIICEKEGYLPFGKWITLPEYNLDVNLIPENPEMVELIITVKNKNTTQLLDSIQYLFENINGFDRFRSEKRQTFYIPLQLIKIRNNVLRLNIERNNYQYSNQVIVFNEDEKLKKFKEVELFMQPNFYNDFKKPSLNTTDISKLAVFVPGLYQFKTKRVLLGTLFLSSEIISIIGVIVSQSQYNHDLSLANLNKGNATLFNSYTDRADNWALARNISIVTAIVSYIINLSDGLFYKPNYSHALNSFNISPYLATDQTGIALTINIH